MATAISCVGKDAAGGHLKVWVQLQQPLWVYWYPHQLNRCRRTKQLCVKLSHMGGRIGSGRSFCYLSSPPSWAWPTHILPLRCPPDPVSPTPYLPPALKCFRVITNGSWTSPSGMEAEHPPVLISAPVPPSTWLL